MTSKNVITLGPNNFTPSEIIKIIKEIITHQKYLWNLLESLFIVIRHKNSPNSYELMNKQI